MLIQPLFDEKKVKNYHYDLRLEQRANLKFHRAVLFISFLFNRIIELIFVSSNLEYYPSAGRFVRWQSCGAWPYTPRCAKKMEKQPYLVLGGGNNENGGKYQYTKEKELIYLRPLFFSSHTPVISDICTLISIILSFRVQFNFYICYSPRKYY